MESTTSLGDIVRRETETERNLPPWRAKEGPTPWSGFARKEGQGAPPNESWLPRWGQEDPGEGKKEQETPWQPEWDQPPGEGKEGKRKARPYPLAKIEPEAVKEKEKNWWERLHVRRREEVREDDDGRRRKRITPSNYSAMEIHGFFGLVDDGSCGQGRMLICHVPSWVRGQFMDLKDGDQVHVWNVNGKGRGVLDVIFTGRHRYYSPGTKVSTCTICVPEEQWAQVAGQGARHAVSVRSI
jgi:hypothetical protein